MTHHTPHELRCLYIILGTVIIKHKKTHDSITRCHETQKFGLLVNYLNCCFQNVSSSICHFSSITLWTCSVTTLALGLRPRQGLANVWAKSEAQEFHFMFPRVWESVREWTSTFPNEFPFWELESQWTSKFSKSDCRGQNPLDWRVYYIIGKLLERKFLKWAHTTHLSI